MIDVRDISKYYASKRAVNNLSFSISEGEIVGLLGLNGAGKSTVLKILSCFLQPTEGEALIGGYSVTKQPQKVRELIGFLPDTPPLYGEMTVTSYLRYVAKLKGCSLPLVEDMVANSMDKTNLAGYENVQLSELSQGYRQRVGIAQAIVHNPKVLILDEPINGLDPVQIIEMRDLILSLKGRHTVILSSHILSEITKTCDRVLVIENGQMVAQGEQKDLLAGLSQKIEIELELLKSGPHNEKFFEQIEGVVAVKSSASPKGVIYKLTCQQDIRAVLSRVAISENFELISLKKKEAELESLFLRLLGKEKGDV